MHMLGMLHEASQCLSTREQFIDKQVHGCSKWGPTLRRYRVRNSRPIAVVLQLKLLSESLAGLVKTKIPPASSF